MSTAPATSSPASPAADADHAERAERILATARELLLAWGYKRVTVGEIARHARIGKGTVYLHWKTKEVLFAELLRREFLTITARIAERIEQDPAIALPDRLVRELFLQQGRSPLARAIRTGDGDLLGALAMTPAGDPVARELGHLTLLTDLVEAWRGSGVLDTGMPAADQIYLIDAVLSGFIAGGIVPADATPSDERCADLLALALRGAVMPPNALARGAVDSTAEAVLAVLANAANG
ncbi:TetR/AcrR family transcriptional regulator [Streptomyces sp. BH106]|uniref:TetR/AcrR family transcriptional regulator n=1 Tax=Streptomyces sp. BH106 TaxID=3410409 RepID=UPI003CF96C13